MSVASKSLQKTDPVLYMSEELLLRSQSLDPQRTPKAGSCMTNTTCFSDPPSVLYKHEDVTGSSSIGYVQLHKRQRVPSCLPSDQERVHEPE